MDPLKMVSDRVNANEKKVDDLVKALHIKIDDGFKELREQITDLYKFKWKIIGGAGFAGFFFYGLIQIATVLFNKTGG